MQSDWRFLGLGLYTAFSVASAHADPLPASPQLDEVAAATPAKSGSEIELQVGPRFWYIYGTGAVARPTSPNVVGQGASMVVPMGGAVFSARFNLLPDTTFSLSFLRGEPEGLSFDSVGAPFAPSAASIAQQTGRGERYDFEFLGQTRIPETNFAWIGGLRLELDKVNNKTISYPYTSPPSNTQTLFSAINQSVYTGKIGVAGATPISSLGDLRLFGNFMVFGGLLTQSSGVHLGVIGPDMSVGAQYTVTPDFILV